MQTLFRARSLGLGIWILGLGIVLYDFTAWWTGVPA
jgi:hypothetical protein